jgi:hypothetical protein
MEEKEEYEKRRKEKGRDELRSGGRNWELRRNTGSEMRTVRPDQNAHGSA